MALVRELYTFATQHAAMISSSPHFHRSDLLRRPTEADIAAVMGDDERPERIDFDLFETIARSVFRRVAVDCSKRLFVSIVGGTAAVAVLKQTLRRAPLVGCAASPLRSSAQNAQERSRARFDRAWR